VTKARGEVVGAVAIMRIAFLLPGASLLVGAAIAWLSAAFGGQHRDSAIDHHFWRRWEVDRMFFIR
jgi:hypothetical protein